MAWLNRETEKFHETDHRWGGQTWEFGIGSPVVVVHPGSGRRSLAPRIIGTGTLVKAARHGRSDTFRLTVQMEDGSTRQFSSRNREEWGSGDTHYSVPTMEPPFRLAYWQECVRQAEEAVLQQRTYNELRSLVDGLARRDLRFQRAALKTLKRLIELDNRRQQQED